MKNSVKILAEVKVNEDFQGVFWRLIMNKDIGSRVKALRLENKLTLKDLSEKTELSTGFLSQLERGMTSIAVDALNDIAMVFDVDLNHFFPKVKSSHDTILHYQDQKIFQIENMKYMHYHLSSELENKSMLPRLVEILPGETDEDISEYGHMGEEFIYVLEGCLTLFIDDEKHVLYPRDTAHYMSERPHNWANYTSQVVKILVVSVPNPFSEKKV
tara:strand:- start:467 stop:1111 length:645 start_codon:yes stop_codon:yes gene_type:complete